MLNVNFSQEELIRLTSYELYWQSTFRINTVKIIIIFNKDNLGFFITENFIKTEDTHFMQANWGFITFAKKNLEFDSKFQTDYQNCK